MVTRLLTAGTVVALSAAALGTRPTASAAAPGSQAVVHSPLVKPVKLDRKNAQLKLVQVVFRSVPVLIDLRPTYLCVSNANMTQSGQAAA